jgi:hypothetical protein
MVTHSESYVGNPCSIRRHVFLKDRGKEFVELQKFGHVKKKIHTPMIKNINQSLNFLDRLHD